MKSVASLAAVALLSGTTEAFWRMPCHSRTGLMRLDPIVDVGKASSHSHAIHGGSNFADVTTYDMLRESDCTSCQFSDDKSAYWTPSMHFVHENGKVEVVPQVGGMLAYYLLLGENLKAFPKGFQMLAGDSLLRNFTGPEPDKPTSEWGPEDLTQFSLGQKALGFNCMNYNKKPEGSRYRHRLPDKQFLDDNCDNGIRAEIFFPSCWNGKDMDTDDHKSHVAYPSLIDGGSCPEGFPVRLPSLFYETIWNTNKFKGKAGQFVFSNGDPTGSGYHGDFMAGWDVDLLQAAVNDCTNPSGRVEDCVHFQGSLQSELKQGMCKIKDVPKILKNDNCDGPADGLCGNVPIQYGPGKANPMKPGDGGKPSPPVISSVAAPPALSYAPARSQGVGGISVYNVKTDAPVAAAAKPTPTPEAKAPVAQVAPPAPAAPVVTQAAKVEEAAAPKGKIVSTSIYTSAGVVYEMAIEEVAVTITVTEGAAKKHRRHAHHRRHQL